MRAQGAFATLHLGLPGSCDRELVRGYPVATGSGQDLCLAARADGFCLCSLHPDAAFRYHTRRRRSCRNGGLGHTFHSLLRFDRIGLADAV